MTARTTDLLTTAEAATLRGLSVRRIRQLCQRGDLRDAVKRGRDWDIPRAAVEAWQPRASGRPGHRRGER